MSQTSNGFCFLFGRITFCLWPKPAEVGGITEAGTRSSSQGFLLDFVSHLSVLQDLGFSRRS